MAQVYAIFFIFFVTTVVGSTPAYVSSNLFSSIEVVNDNSTFREVHPDAEIVPLLEGGTKAAGLLTYTLGKKTAYDRLIATGANKYSFPDYRSFKLTLTYPAIPGMVAEKVTYVEINTLQTNTLGRAYVTAGGIGQKHITIVVEARGTKYFEYKANFYNSATRLQALGLLAPLVSLLFFQI